MEIIKKEAYNLANKGSRTFGKQIKAIFFDLDNTLIPTRRGDEKACQKLSDILQTKYGLTSEIADETTTNFLQAFRSCPDNTQTTLDSWRSYLWTQSLPQNLKYLNETIYKQWLQLRYKYVTIPTEYEVLLRNLRKQYRIGLITNGPSNAQWEKVNKLNIRSLFDCILVSGDLPWEKPNPNIFYMACNLLNVHPNESIMIGDKMETDIQGGKAANFAATIHISHMSSKPDYLIEKLGQLLYVPKPSSIEEISSNDKRRHSLSSGMSGNGNSCLSGYNNSQNNGGQQHAQRRNLYHSKSLTFDQRFNKARKVGDIKRVSSFQDSDSNSENSSDSIYS
ncbi:N-acylneuraminate-9-phosphatase [Condylostylus longicornis]|uniref:N-acylneuraminate-9-phosphatase n=1 Tax=Condylostylus longicornis TaxID=2530218 RepID=UPI00244DD5F0|nr:N-acylneuraminate-9-phosphatase [Condylostylus longicornis]